MGTSNFSKEEEEEGKRMIYPKRIMRKSELIKLGFSKTQLEIAYLSKGQSFARKINPLKRNSPILFDTEGLEKFLQRQSKLSIAK